MHTEPLTLFYWKGLSAREGRVQGTQSAHSVSALREVLAEQGVLLLRAHRPLGTARIPARDMTRLCRQLATLLAGGIPLLRAFELTAAATRRHALKHLLTALSTHVSQGMALAEAMRAYPHCFDTAGCNLVQVGESSATLADMFARIATQREKMHHLRQSLTKALVYPAVVVLIALLVSIGLLTFVVPEFERMFAHFGTTLPAPTRAILSLSHFLTHPRVTHWLLPGLLFVSAGLRWLCKKPRIRLSVERALFAIPGISAFYARLAGMRFATLLATTLGAGIPLTRAMEDIAHMADTHRFHAAIGGILQQIQRGESLHDAMQASGIFEEHLLAMVRTGEDSGTLQSALQEAGLWLESHLQNRFDTLATLIEPAIMAILGLLVGGLVIALYLPVLTLGRVV